MPYYYSPLRKDYGENTTLDTTRQPDACPFCADFVLDQTFTDPSGAYIDNEHYRWVANWYPRAEAHTMVVPKRHLMHLSDETEEEVLARQTLMLRCITILQTAFPESGVEVFLQTGKGSAGSVAHLHWHLVPALPQHALTGFEKLGYFATTQPEEEKVVITPIEITMARDELLTLIANTDVPPEQKG